MFLGRLIIEMSRLQLLRSKEAPSSAFVIEEDEGKVRDLVAFWTEEKAQVSLLDGEEVVSERITEELETMPFLAKKVVCVIRGCERLSVACEKKLLHYLKHPSPWAHLFLFSASKGKLAKACQYVIEKVPPWELEKECCFWLEKEAASSGVALPKEVALELIRFVGVGRCQLQQELEKLICFVGEGQAITKEAIYTLTPMLPQESIWQLGDALFERSRLRSMQIATQLLKSTSSLFPLLAQLRTQVRTGREILSLAKTQGPEAVTARFPYLKGRLRDQKIRRLADFGAKSLLRAQAELYQSELRAREGWPEVVILETLISRITAV